MIGFVFILFAIVYVIGLVSSFAVVLINLMILSIGIFKIREGAKKDNLGILNYGLMIISVLCTLLYLVVVVILHGGFAPISRVISLGRDMLSRNHPAWTAGSDINGDGVVSPDSASGKQSTLGIRAVAGTSAIGPKVESHKSISTGA